LLFYENEKGMVTCPFMNIVVKIASMNLKS